MILLPSDDVDNLEKMKPLVQHRDIDSREIGGAVHWSSLFPKLRRDFERGGARTFSDSQ